jgi:hypothetical protein
MSLDSSYDMILLPSPRDSDNGGRQPARRRRNQRRLPHMAEEQHPGLSRHLPHQRRRGRGNHGQAGGGTSSAVEQVDDTGAPAGDTSGFDLASETKTSVVSPQHTNPKQTNDASTLAKDLLGVTLVPETTVQSAPDATSSPPVDQEVPTDSHWIQLRPTKRPRFGGSLHRGMYQPSGVPYAVALGQTNGRLDLRTLGFRGR